MYVRGNDEALRRDDQGMRVRAGAPLLLLAGFVLGAHLTWTAEPMRPAPAPPFPKDPAQWIGTPASWEALRGRVVLLDVWTFG
jgi:hypothetical protein